MDVIFSLAEINDVAKLLLEKINKKTVLCLYGEMGTGKTTLVKAIAAALAVKDTVSSPTFSIINEYMLADGESMYHLDLYRIKNEEEAIAAGVEHCLYSGRFCIVEWPQHAHQLLPENAVICALTLLPNNHRKLEINL
ncbi:MAG: tRNA (adenosine(37)-N6)-threonylcarbamoyltransferase complex ATPase subunit type 1 TsaE [Niastella sp.]|nr:tRNA (adenosine(37)-N6)-threonylcarbamoyltransferase complex ATPase subunit type 1 TsaE [Niastella sp.]